MDAEPNVCSVFICSASDYRRCALIVSGGSVGVEQDARSSQRRKAKATGKYFMAVRQVDKFICVAIPRNSLICEAREALP